MDSTPGQRPQTGGQTVPCLHNADHEDVAALLDSGQFFWLDLEDASDEKLRKLGERLGLHPLTVDDAQTFNERPKIEEYDNYVYLVIYGVDPSITSGEPLLRQVHLIVSGDYVITIHHGPMATLADLRARIGTHPLRGEQYLIYKVLDAVISTFFPVLTRIDDDIDDIEETVIEEPKQELLRRVFALKRDLVAMRRVVTPMRDVFARNADRITELPGLEADERLYFRDVYDSLIRISDMVDSYRDLLSGTTEMYLSTVANRQGEVSKQLTVIATIFLPLTFITGFFGQNFAFLTNHVINTTWSFLVFGIGGLLLSIAGFLVYFRRKRWT